MSVSVSVSVCARAQIPEAPGSHPVRALHWGGCGGGAGEEKGACAAGISELLVELKTKQVVAAEKCYLVLTTEGQVFNIEKTKTNCDGNFSLMVSGLLHAHTRGGAS